MSRCRHASQSPEGKEKRADESLFALMMREPFRLFFPWGLLVSGVGVALWPAFYAGWFSQYPGQPFDLHGRLMTLGFGGAFVLGFLATAAPRMLGAPRLLRGEVMALWLTHFAAVAALFAGGSRAGCLLFSIAVLVLIARVLSRFERRTDLPPPGFVLVLMGLACGVTGALMHVGGLDFSGGATGFRLSRVLMNEGLMLLPIMGVGGFLLPRILGVPSRQAFPDSLVPTPGWWRVFLEAAVVGLLIVASFVIESQGHIRCGAALRPVVALAWWRRDLPGLWTVRAEGTQAWSLRLGLMMIIVSWLAKIADSVRFIGLEHILFITGFGVTMLAVASRVVDGHSGNRAAAKGASKPLRWIFWLAVLAMTTRVSADYLPRIAVSHHIYAALTWVAICVIWLWSGRRKLATPDPEGDG